MVALTPPRYGGHFLGNLINELEDRLSGTSCGTRLASNLQPVIPDRSGYVLVLFDGLGRSMINDRFPVLQQAQVGYLDAPFPTTTSVSLATIATGMTPAEHGILGHFMLIPELGQVVNTLRWEGRGGARLKFDTGSLLPAPNLWERLSRAGVEVLTVQPPIARGSKLSAMLYRGCSIVYAETWSDWVEYLVSLAQPGRLVLGYTDRVDVAAHQWGVRSKQCQSAISQADRAWDRLAQQLTAEVGLVGCSDHGLIDIAASGKRVLGSYPKDLRVAGDPRGLAVHGQITEELELRWGISGTPIASVREWWGPGNHPNLDELLPTKLFVAPPGQVFLPSKFDRRMVGYHGGLDPDELHIPLLVRPG